MGFFWSDFWWLYEFYGCCLKWCSNPSQRIVIIFVSSPLGLDLKWRLSDQLWQVKTMIEQLITKMQDQVLTLLEVMRFMKDRKVLRWVIALFLVTSSKGTEESFCRFFLQTMSPHGFLQLTLAYQLYQKRNLPPVWIPGSIHAMVSMVFPGQWGGH